jgi:hypothetical protein
MADRLKHFRAGLVLALSSAVLFWPISYWFPLPEYLGVLGSEDYADYALALRSIVIIYLVFLLLNLVTAGLAATKLSHTLKFWLALGPAAIILVLPFILIIPTALSFPDRNYFEIFQAMYRLLRFSSPQLLALALICTLISVALNIRAALMFRAAPDPGAINPKIRTRYFIYAGVALLVFAVIVPLGAYNGALRSQDRAACNRYAALEIPQLDEDVPTFLSEIRVIGESAGNRSLQNLLINFSDISRQYLSLLDTEPEGSLALKEIGTLTAQAKDEVARVCSEYGSK